jgi:hypothetical protein
MKLSEIQAQLKVPKNNRNTFGNYNYRSAEDIIEAVKKIINPNGLSLIISDELVEVGGRVYIKATASIGEHSATGFAREEETKKGMDAAQITGSASSYARKYALNGLLAIDDTKDADSMPPQEETPAQKAIMDIRKVNGLDGLKLFWEALPAEIKTNKAVMEAKENRKKILTENLK